MTFLGRLAIRLHYWELRIPCCAAYPATHSVLHAAAGALFQTTRVNVAVPTPSIISRIIHPFLQLFIRPVLRPLFRSILRFFILFFILFFIYPCSNTHNVHTPFTRTGTSGMKFPSSLNSLSKSRLYSASDRARRSASDSRKLSVAKTSGAPGGCKRPTALGL